jgi:nicotinate phosphoribosyltransferase
VISPLLTDLYQLTMAYGYWKLKMHEREAVFQLIFRNHPFRSNYTVAAGLGPVIEFLQNWQFRENDLAYLSKCCAPNGEVLFPAAFLDYLKTLRFTGNLDAIPEGTVVFPQEPLLRVTAPLIQGQLLESTLLNLINFQTLIATKAARICHIAGHHNVLEFGLRRAQGPDGALSASRAAYIGGCAATSNVLAGQLYDIPVRGTHAHSWVTAFPDEMAAFTAYAEVMPHNCVLLVDTYDTIQGIQHAIKVGQALKARGAALQGIRLDSGDMASLSQTARNMLDEAGFLQTEIIASNSLDEYVIAQMKQKGADISVWGVGTHLVTSYDHPALDGVYKLSALRNDKGQWEYKLKLSEQISKISTPGIYQVRRFLKQNSPVMDVMYDTELDISSPPEMISLTAPFVTTQVGTAVGFGSGSNVGSGVSSGSDSNVGSNVDSSVDLLKPIFVKGQCVYEQGSIHSLREHALQQVSQFLQAYPKETYPVGLDKKLHDVKLQLILRVSNTAKKTV